jgi:hypothetical protein
MLFSFRLQEIFDAQTDPHTVVKPRSLGTSLADEGGDAEFAVRWEKDRKL